MQNRQALTGGKGGRERPLGKESTAPVALKTNQTKKFSAKASILRRVMKRILADVVS
jgi:hypothetical protein